MNTATATPDTRPVVLLLAESEVRRLRQAIDDVSQLHTSGLIEEEQALQLVVRHWDAGRSALLTIRRAQRARQLGAKA
jgi:hypothetical protein